MPGVEGYLSLSKPGRSAGATKKRSNCRIHTNAQLRVVGAVFFEKWFVLGFLIYMSMIDESSLSLISYSIFKK